MKQFMFPQRGCGRSEKESCLLSDFLHEQYATMGRTMQDIADELGISRQRVDQLIARYGVPRRGAAEAAALHRRAFRSDKDKERLHQMFVAEKKTIKEIAFALEVSSRIVVDELHRMGLDTPRNQLRGVRRNHEDAICDAIWKAYVELGMTQAKIADQLGIHQTRVSNYMRRFGIPSRNPGRRSSNMKNALPGSGAGKSVSAGRFPPRRDEQ